MTSAHVCPAGQIANAVHMVQRHTLYMQYTVHILVVIPIHARLDSVTLASSLHASNLVYHGASSNVLRQLIVQYIEGFALEYFIMLK